VTSTITVLFSYKIPSRKTVWISTKQSLKVQFIAQIKHTV